ncbi:MAG: single-stranded-DNA-specific exonuclease RecJ [Methylotenera sp.]|nr:single-stranded-DNA-specific exonuclease RecJ [Methylotenera sp.]
MQIKQRAYDATIAKALTSKMVPPLLARLYAARGVVAQDALETSLSQLISPDLLTDNHLMAQLLADAIQSHQHLLVIGDYDADGATATAVAVKGLRSMGAQVDFLVPNRFEYGYGLTPEIVALAAQKNPDVIITVDNGIASVEGVAAANALGIQVLITDHHLPAEVTPQAACIVNPNQQGCTFPSKHLAGVGVMFYVLLALRATLRSRGAFSQQTEPNLTELLDLVALGTVADLVKLDANNRILVEQGLRRIRAGACSAGITALLQVAKCTPYKLSAQDLGFYVGPRLNAAGRLDDMRLGIDCLLAETAAEATQKAQTLHELNQERRNIEADMQAGALLALDDIQVQTQYTLSLFQPDWHQGVIGILASRLKERYHRPTIVFADAGDGLLKGSGRSIASLHLRDALDLITKQHSALILKFGGHAMAAGLTIKQANFEAFSQAFEDVVRSQINPADLDAVLEVDGNIGDDLSFATAQMLESQVWGQGFAPPLFFDAFSVINQRVVGEKHLKLTLKNNHVAVDAIYFNQTDFLPNHIQAAYQLQTNEFNGAQKMQLNIRHVVST